MASSDPFAILGLPHDAAVEAIKAAWRRLARQHHPDLTSGDPDVERRATRRMAEINAAYQELRDPQKRQAARASAARREDASEWRRRAAAAEGDPAGQGPGPNRANGHGDGAEAPPPGASRRVRPVTARIDTSQVFHPRNTTLHPLKRSPLPGLPPRPRNVESRQDLRASDPTGPTFRDQGLPHAISLPTLSDALATPLSFGKFEGRTLGEVAQVEPSYIDWMVRTIGRDVELLAAARVVHAYLSRSGAASRQRFDAAGLGS